MTPGKVAGALRVPSAEATNGLERPGQSPRHWLQAFSMPGRTGGGFLHPAGGLVKWGGRKTGSRDGQAAPADVFRQPQFTH